MDVFFVYNNFFIACFVSSPSEVIFQIAIVESPFLKSFKKEKTIGIRSFSD
jgi:hypothetical protein